MADGVVLKLGNSIHSSEDSDQPDRPKMGDYGWTWDSAVETRILLEDR